MRRSPEDIERIAVRRRLLAAGLFVAAAAFAAQPAPASSFGATGLSLAKTGARAASQIDPATSALIARMTTAPSGVRIGLIDKLIRALKAAGVWSKFDLFYVTAAHDSQAARLNWVSTSFNLTAISGPTFTTDRGYAGDGLSSYLTTGWTPSTNAVNYALNSAAFGCYLNAGTNTASNTAVAMGCASTGTASFITPYAASGHILARMNAATPAATSTGSAASRLGSTAVSRRDASNISFYRNGALDSAVALASVSLPTQPVFLCGLSSTTGTLSSPLDNRIACAWAASGLTDTEVTNVYAAINTFLTAIGAN